MRNAIGAGTQTSKIPTRVALLYISLFRAYTIQMLAGVQGNILPNPRGRSSHESA